MTVLRNTRLFEIIQLRCSSLLNYHLSGLTTFSQTNKSTVLQTLGFSENAITRKLKNETTM